MGYQHGYEGRYVLDNGRVLRKGEAPAGYPGWRKGYEAGYQAGASDAASPLVGPGRFGG